MPRRARPDVVLAAACRVAAAEGLPKASVERVAADAGVSPSLVYYYFGTREGLISATFRFANLRSTTHTLEQVDLDADPRDQLDAIMALELDDAPEVQENWLVWLQLEALAVFDDAVRGDIQASDGEWITIVSDLVAQVHARNGARPDLDHSQVARRLTATVDGLGSLCSLGVMERDQARVLMQATIDEVLGPR